MGLVLLIWLLQLGTLVYFTMRGSGGFDLAERLLRIVRSPAIIALGLGCIGFVIAGARAARNYDFSGVSIAGLSFWVQFVLLTLLALALFFARFGGGGPDMVFGSARFATPAHAEARGLLGETGIRLGYLRNPDPDAYRKELASGVRRPLHYTGERHLLTIAPTRAGKGVSTIIPNLLTYPGSAIIIDPKGENATITYDKRAGFGRAFALDPWGITGKPVARFNPLDLLVPDSATLIEDALLIADALIVPDSGGSTQFWSDEARALVMGFLLYLATDPHEARTLGRLRDILSGTPAELAAVGKAMVRSSHPVVVAAAARLVGKTDNERSGILSTAQQNTHFLDSPAMRASLAASDFRFGDLKGDRPASVYVVLPVDRLATYSRWLRLIVALGIADLSRNPAKPARPVLFMLDEFAQLGHMAIIENAYGLMAGLGIQLHAIVQDISQLERLYGRGWQTFVGNAGVIQVFGTRDLQTAEYVSKLIGVTTRTVRSTSSSSTSGSSSGSGTQPGSTNSSTSRSVSWAPTQRPLLFPDELCRMDRNAQILLVENADPVLGEKLDYRTYIP